MNQYNKYLTISYYRYMLDISHPPDLSVSSFNHHLYTIIKQESLYIFVHFLYVWGKIFLQLTNKNTYNSMFNFFFLPHRNWYQISGTTVIITYCRIYRCNLLFYLPMYTWNYLTIPAWHSLRIENFKVSKKKPEYYHF